MDGTGAGTSVLHDGIHPVYYDISCAADWVVIIIMQLMLEVMLYMLSREHGLLSICNPSRGLQSAALCPLMHA